MKELMRKMQGIIDEMDRCIREGQDEALTLGRIAARAGYSEYYFSRKFREIAGMSLREYVRLRRLAFALKRIRDSDEGLMQIALGCGFSSHEAFSRAFRAAYGISPSQYRRHPVPVALRTVIRPLDCYLLEEGGPDRQDAPGPVRSYLVTIPAHRFLHIRNYESIGYWDFWQKMGRIPGMDCETVCGLLDSIPGKLDDLGGRQANSGSGQIMAYINEPEGRICSWGIPLAEGYGVRLPADYSGPVPGGMLLTDVPEGEYVVFEHGPFDYEGENAAVEARMERAMAAFDYAACGRQLDMTWGRIFYFYHDPERFWKYIRPVRRL